MAQMILRHLYQGVLNGKRVTRQAALEEVEKAVLIYQQENRIEEKIEIVYIGTEGKTR